MNAYDRLKQMIRTSEGQMTVWSQPEVDAAFDAYRAEILAEEPPAPSPEFNAAVARRAQLLAEITARGGEWTTRRTHNLYKSLGITGLFRSTVREDLAAVHRAGHLVQHDEPGRRFYTAKGGGDRG
ncbi:hypothetical protein [Streptomyces parvulus]|uniref:hypothetical protein n=1 Tax=Streptomyces parvulus TaxID=146923 RepID=UPI00371AE2C0